MIRQAAEQGIMQSVMIMPEAGFTTTALVCKVCVNVALTFARLVTPEAGFTKTVLVKACANSALTFDRMVMRNLCLRLNSLKLHSSVKFA